MQTNYLNCELQKVIILKYIFMSYTLHFSHAFTGETADVPKAAETGFM